MTTSGSDFLKTAADVDRSERIESLNRRYADAGAEEILEAAVRSEFPRKIALVSSFGTDSAVLLHLTARIDPMVPVIFLDTEKHFDETLDYRDRLVAVLGLKDVRSVKPEPIQIGIDDPVGTLNRTNPELCCYLRKTLPMIRALKGFACWITGRKRYQTPDRERLPIFESQDRWFKVNPLANWTKDDLESYMTRFTLPRHPLRARGYFSVGCAPCTTPVFSEDADERSGRWRGQEKTECGIHFVDGRMVRKAGR